MTRSTAASPVDSPAADALALLRARPRAALELGCGGSKRDPDAVGIDLLPAPGVDVAADALVVLQGLPDACVDRIESSHFLEHVDDLDAVMAQSERVLKPHGEFIAVVPHHSNAWYYSDPTHRTFFGLYTMSYYADDDLFRRRVPAYRRGGALRVERVDLIFKSSRPFYGRHAVKKVWQIAFNTTRYGKELYEEMFSRVLPCYELRFVLRKKGAP